MAIVKMKRLRLIAMARDQDKLAEDLLNAGCVEISQPPQEQREGYEGLLCRDSAELPRDRAGLSQLQSALDVLKKLAPVKEGLLAPRRQVDRRELLDGGTRERACRLAEEINSRSKTLGQLAARETRLRADALKAAITPRTKLLIMPFPNNPTGAVMEREDLEAIAEVLRDTNVMVLSDEIYAELNYGLRPHVSIATLPGMAERTIVVNGFSKSYAMTGWRLGYACGPAPIIKIMTKIHQSAIMSAPTLSLIHI